MEHTRLEAATLEDLRQEALRYQLPESASFDKETLIEAILANLKGAEQSFRRNAATTTIAYSERETP